MQSGKQTGLELVPELWPPPCLPRASGTWVVKRNTAQLPGDQLVLDSVPGAGRDSHVSPGFGGLLAYPTQVPSFTLAWMCPGNCWVFSLSGWAVALWMLCSRREDTFNITWVSTDTVIVLFGV